MHLSDIVATAECKINVPMDDTGNFLINLKIIQNNKKRKMANFSQFFQSYIAQTRVNFRKGTQSETRLKRGELSRSVQNWKPMNIFQ